MHAVASSVRPPLKWAGGKRQLLPALSSFFPQQFARYVEPFVGSGAVFFHLASSGALGPRPALLADVNADLIGCYRVLRDSVERVIAALRELEREHRRDGDACYYAVRDTRFNPRRAALFARLDPAAAASRYPADLAAMLIFLNRTGFNGLYRLNRRGLFNVPAGRYDEPRICDADHLRDVARTFARPGTAIEYRAFDETLEDAGAGDFVYCDPPYAPLSRTASFAHYTAGGFGPFDQRRLQQAVVSACRRGARVLLSNSSALEIVALYSSRAARDAGLVVTRVPARRAINSRASARGPVDELIVSNVPERPRSDALEALGRTRPAMLKVGLNSLDRSSADGEPGRRTRRTCALPQAPATQTSLRQLGQAKASRRSETNDT
jgi:DNA adenine methylase